MRFLFALSVAVLKSQSPLKKSFIGLIKLVCSIVYPVYNHIFLSGNLSLISCNRENTSCIFSSANGSPPRIDTLVICGLSINSKNLCFILNVHSFPLLKSHVSLLKQFLQWKWHPWTNRATPTPSPFDTSNLCIFEYLMTLLLFFIFQIV